MRTALILIQAGFLGAMAVLGAASADRRACPLPAPTAQHCAIPE